jgi:hypothetical protein
MLLFLILGVIIILFATITFGAPVLRYFLAKDSALQRHLTDDAIERHLAWVGRNSRRIVGGLLIGGLAVITVLYS